MRVISVRINFLYEFGVALIIVLAMSMICLNSAEKIRESSDWVAHTHEVLTRINKLEYVVKCAESSQRSYLISNQNADLDDYLVSTRYIPLLVREIETLVKDNKQQTENIRKLKPLIDKRIDLLRATLNADRTSKEKAFDIVRTGRGRLVMGEINNLSNEMIEIEESLLQIRMNRESDAQQMNFNIIIFTCVISMVIVFGCISFVTNLRT